jgi:asparagine synthase (glutamine-hydrolysing)
LIANAEIYNFMDLKEKYGFKFESGSDCEIFLHLFEKYGNVDDFINELDGVFAFILHDADTGITYIGRDPIGVRPIFYGVDENGNMMVASEAKVINGLVKPDTIRPFPAGSHWNSQSREFVQFWNPTYNLEEVNLEKYDESADLKKTAELLYKGVIKRMLSDRSIGTFLSGGLDSSLVSAFILKYIKESGK